MKQMSLAIARDVHEIKKDYIRIIQGIEQEISEEFDEKRMSFQDLLNILEATTHHLLEEKSVHIVLEFQCTRDFMTEEHYELMAILKNIVNNAIEAIEGAHKHGAIQIVEQYADGIYEFKVRDNGPGISPRHLPNIFKMGYSTKFDYKTGNIFRGVGLYGVKTTVEEHFGGTIDVESEPGKGTVFTIRIPAKSLEEE
jgi:two-component system sensor histidine kinase YcbA